MDNFHVYKDIEARTGGDIYIGVVGPVRSGKSTFIKRFMELLVIPAMEDENQKNLSRDELPQSAAGKTIMTTEPKFIPKEAAKIQLGDGISVKVRLIDCVGFMVEGAAGHIENDAERMVKTPWFDYEIPFTKAAEIGTRKVITDHSTIGIVVTTDGSFGDIKRPGYITGEQTAVEELKAMGKPFIILLNCERPYSEESIKLAEELEEKYGVSVMPVNCEQLKKEDVNRILEKVLKDSGNRDGFLHSQVAGAACAYPLAEGKADRQSKRHDSKNRIYERGDFRKTDAGGGQRRNRISASQGDGYGRRLCGHGYSGR